MMLQNNSNMFDKVIDEMSAYALQEDAKKSRRKNIIQLGGTEPTDYKIADLVEFYIIIKQEMDNYADYAAENPDQPKTLKVKKRIIREGICDIVDPQAAWNVLRSQNSELTPGQFKKMDPSERHNQFVSVLEKDINDLRDLQRKRSYAIDLGKKQEILSADYR